MFAMDKILDYLDKNESATSKQLAESLGIPRRTVNHNLAILWNVGGVDKRKTRYYAMPKITLEEIVTWVKEGVPNDEVINRIKKVYGL